MSDNLVEFNRALMIERFGIRVGTGVEIICRNSYLSAILQALFACEEFRVKIILIGHHHQNLNLHRSIGKLFKYMVIGKEMFVIPNGIIAYVNRAFENIFEERNPHIVLGTLLQAISDSYQQFLQILQKDQHLQNRNLYPCASDVFSARIHIICKNETCANFHIRYITDNIFTVSLQIGQQFSNIQEELFKIEKENCERIRDNLGLNECQICSQQTTEIVEWAKPRVLILGLNPPQSLIEVENMVTIQNEQYSLFACICNLLDERIYCCYAKHGGMWYLFKGRFARVIPSLVRLNDVCVLFYKKVVSIDYSNFITEIDTTGVIPQLQLNYDENQRRILYEEITSYRPLTTTNVDLITDQNEFIANQKLGNLFGYCSMNSTLQALYHCRIFRKYILSCNENVGNFHKCLKKLFTGIKLNNRKLVKTSHMAFYNLLKQTDATIRSQISIFVYLQIIENLDNEMEMFTRQYDMLPLVQRDYANVMIGREDMSSNDAWIQYMINGHNSSMRNMFTVQVMRCERCRYGHKNALYFIHKTSIDLSLEILESVNPVFDSFQAIIDYFKGPVQPNYPHPGRFCDSCPQNDPLNRLYRYYEPASINRACDVLVFNLPCWKDPKDPQNPTKEEFRKLKLEINEQLIVCGNKYKCVAMVVFVEQKIHMHSTANHAYTFALCDDNQWWYLEDNFLEKIGNMPQSDTLQDNHAIDVVFYQKIVDNPNIKLIDELVFETSIDLASLGIKRKQLYLRPNSNPNTLTLKASKVGIDNPNGRTSYMNAVIQCFYHCSVFRKYVIFDRKPSIHSKPIHELLNWFFVNLTVTNLNSIDQTGFWNIFTRIYHQNFSKNREYDPKKFVSAIIRDLVKEYDDSSEENAILENNGLIDNALNSYRNKANLNIVNMFGLIYEQKIHCKSEPLHRRITYKAEYILELEISNLTLTYKLQSLLNAYLMKLNLRDRKALCNDCGFDALNIMTVLRLPNILVIKLNIFAFDKKDLRIIKLKPNVEITEQIEFYDQIFSFRACICCDGDTQQSFHFSAFVKCDDGLYHFDDINVTQSNIKLDDLKDVYMLFYEKYLVNQ